MYIKSIPILSYGSEDFNWNVNKEILKATINFLKIFERSNDALFDFESSVLFKTQKKYFVFESRLNFFFKWSYLQRCFNVAQRYEKSTLKMTTLFRCCLTLFNSTLVYTTFFQRWFDVATSYQPKSNIEPTLKCLLCLI